MSALGVRGFAAAALLCICTAAFAHHGMGLYDRSKPVELHGVIRGIDFVNPHSYLRFDVIGADGKTIAMHCEMRAATLLRRSGWTPEMFVAGAQATVYGFAHRDDQFEVTSKTDLSNRPARLPSGVPNISGDWAQEQWVIARGAGGLVPKHLVADVESGKVAVKDIPPSGWGARPVTFTARGKAEADAFRMWSPEDNPRLRCRPTSIILDWVFDGPVNRITQEKDRIVIDYGLFSFERVIHMNMAAHPKSIAPSYAGHSIGHWEGDVLVVDTIGFEPGLLAAPVKHSDQLHVVERFKLDPKAWTLTRDYVAEDPVYFTDKYVGSDTVLVADVPYEPHPCNELTPEFRPSEKP